MDNLAKNRSYSGLIKSADNDSGFATTLAKGLAVLEVFTPERRELRNSEIAAALGLPRSTVARLTSTLETLGYLKQVRRKYTLAWHAMTLAHPLLAGFKILSAARPGMEALAHDLGGTISIGVLENLNYMYIETARAKDSLWTAPDAGQVGPLAPAAIGHALCSLLEDDERLEITAQLPESTPNLWKKFKQHFVDGVAQCKEDGVCYIRGDWWPEIHTAAAPLFRDENGDCFAINCRVPVYRLDTGQLENEVGPRLKSLASSIRSRMEDE